MRPYGIVAVADLGRREGSTTKASALVITNSSGGFSRKRDSEQTEGPPRRAGPQ